MKNRKRMSYNFPIVTAVGEFRKDYNLLLKQGDEAKRLISFSMIPDGSLIVFNHAPQTGKQYAGKRITARKGKQIFKLRDMEQVQHGTSAVPGKTTFHASGVVNFENERRGVRTSLKTMDVTQPLVTYLHPQFPELKPLQRGISDRDLTFDYDEWPSGHHPMVKVYISPPGEANIIHKYLKNEPTQVAVFVQYKGEQIRHSAKELIVQVTLHIGPRSGLPRRSCQFFLTDNEQLVAPELKPRHDKV